MSEVVILHFTEQKLRLSEVKDLLVFKVLLVSKVCIASKWQSRGRTLIPVAPKPVIPTIWLSQQSYV